MKAYYTVEVRDKHGKLVRRYRRKSHSFVEQWNQQVCLVLAGADRTIRQINNTEYTCTTSSANFLAATAAGNDDHSLLVGTGVTAVAITDYKLETPIAEGTGSGEMNYQAGVVSAYTVGASDCSFTLTRSVINNSGATITVKEIGIYIYCYSVTGGAPLRALACRDVLASTLDVPDGGSITVVYTLKVSV